MAGYTPIGARDCRKERRPWLRLSNYQPPAGWRGTVLVASCLVGAVLLTNASILIWVLLHGSTIAQGNCKTASRAYTASHVTINLLSTLLLAASNMCLQILSSPSRYDVDRSHRQGKWLSLGVLSVRNIQGKRRIALAMVLILSSLPLHFFYNSVFSYQLSVYEYDYVFALEDFLAGQPLDQYNVPGTALSSGRLSGIHDQLWDKDTERLDWRECLTRFENGITTNYSAVVALATDKNFNKDTSPVLQTGTAQPVLSVMRSAGLWMCKYQDSDNNIVEDDVFGVQFCNVASLLSNPSGWRMTFGPPSAANNSFTFDSCLAVAAPERCSISFHTPLMWLVIACNVAKLACFVLVLHTVRERPLITLGDCVASFLAEPAQSADHTQSPPGPTLRKLPRWRKIWQSDITMHMILLRGGPHRWLEAASGGQWLIAISSCALLTLVGTIMLLMNLKGASWNWTLSGAEIAYNTVDFRKVGGLTADPATVGVSLLINLPQILVASVYLLYNNIFTCMQTAVEFSRFAREPQPLRVSEPRGEQKSTYRLQLPYRYSLPLILTMAGLHWLISAGLYLVDIELLVHTTDSPPIGGITFTPDEDVSIITAGWNPAPVALSVVVGVFMTFFLVWSSFRPFPGRTKVMRSNSLALAAACRRAPGEGPDMVERKVMYGRLDVIDDNGKMFEGFTSRIDEVIPIEEDPARSHVRHWLRMKPKPFQEESHYELKPLGERSADVSESIESIQSPSRSTEDYQRSYTTLRRRTLDAVDVEDDEFCRPGLDRRDLV